MGRACGATQAALVVDACGEDVAILQQDDAVHAAGSNLDHLQHRQAGSGALRPPAAGASTLRPGAP